MSSATPVRCRRSAMALACSLSVLLAFGLNPVASADPPEAPELSIPTDVSTESDYIVTLADAPIAAYEGDVTGYDATQPADGQDVELDSADAKRYRSYLRKRQDTVAARIGSTPDERFEVGLNAFTAEITGEQAATLARTDGVLSVHKNVLRRMPDNKKSVDFLGLSGHEGVWSELGGTEDAGRGVVVGVIDSGIWPESDSFAGEPLESPASIKKRSARTRYVPTRSGNTITMTKSDGGTFTGTCQTGEQFTVDDCNSKIVGARYFDAAWPAGERSDSEFVSPRDGEGHGSHTASIAAGNTGVRAVVDERDFGRISGVAPAAKIASYKVLWQAKKPEESGAYDSDIVDAIDAAIGDGVDVINFSITSADDPTNAVQQTLRTAAQAGIFVAASAGNSGPGASTVQSTSPWVTTVGAHTIAPYYGTVTLGDGQAYAGISTSVDEPVGPAPLVNGADVKAAGATAENANVCAAESLDSAKTAEKIVVCVRGVVDRTVKSAEVERAGGLGMVLINPTANTLDADLHSVPTVHVDWPASTKITAYAKDTPGATATLTEGNATSTVLTYPQIATFSARGPSVGTGGDTLKPDLVAPGVSILGAVAPPSNDGQNFAFQSGTSESAPQVSGLAALWFGAGVQPTWSPMNIKSALMTTAADLVDGSGQKVTDPFAQGAGRVVPDRMFTPGLVYPAGERDWRGYLAGLDPKTGSKVKAIDPSDYNSPSIAIGRLVGTQTVTRRVTAVTAGRYRVTARVPGVDVDVSPSVLDFSHAGQTRTFRVTFRPTTADFDRAATGFLTWKGEGVAVRIPLAVTPRALEAPVQVAGSGSSGRVRFRVTSGATGTFTAVASGLATGSPRTGSLTLDQSFAYRVRPTPGTKAARFTVRSSAVGANLDLYVYQYDANAVARLVGQSTGPSSSESFVVPKPSSSDSTSTSPVAGDYALQVVNAGNAPGTTMTPFTAQTGLVQATGGVGSFTVTPAETDATAGESFVLTAGWSGLPEAVPYVGWVEYPGGQGTVVTVN
ncbi:MAG TPA: S8 family serine peptidase [Microlunatus sp.]